MKITIEDVYLYVNDFYNLDIKDKTRDDELIICRMFFYYLSLKYCSIVVNYSNIGKFIGIEHGSILNAMSRVDEMIVYEKDNYKRLQLLENDFIEKFKVSENNYNLPITKKDIILLKNRERKNKKTIKDLRSEKNTLNRKLKSIKKAIDFIN